MAWSPESLAVRGPPARVLLEGPKLATGTLSCAARGNLGFNTNALPRIAVVSVGQSPATYERLHKIAPSRSFILLNFNAGFAAPIDLRCEMKWSERA